jgi:hypothetical protein
MINKKFFEFQNELRLQFLNAKPFKHLVIDDFLDEDLICGMISEFPAPKKEEMINEFFKPSLKHTVTNIREIGPSYKALDNLVSSEDFIKFMENITGIEHLIFDPLYFGGGTHNNLSGQGMDPHVDFNFLNIHNIGKVHRRINAIVYLNQEWSEEWGGNLDLHLNPYDPERDQIIRVIPKKNRLILFETNEISWHGFMPVSSCVPPGVTRKSFALYMYTKERPANEVRPRHGTFYVPRMPLEILKEDTIVDNVSLELLKNARTHIMQLIQGIYNKELNVSQFIADREHEISLLKSEIETLKSTTNYEFTSAQWGPCECTIGEIPNIQPDGNMGFWIISEKFFDSPKWKLLFNGHLVELIKNEGGLLTGSIPSELLKTVGLLQVNLLDALSQRLFTIGEFKVSDKQVDI